MRVLQIGSDRSKRGSLVKGSPAYMRQQAYAEKFGALDIIGFSLENDGFTEIRDGALHVHPTRSFSKLLYGIDALLLATRLPWPDVVSAQDPFEAGLTALVISRFLKKPLHVQVHTDFLSPAYANHSWINRLRVRMARIVLSRASGIRVVSERIKLSLQATSYTLQATPTVLPIYVDLERVRGASPDASLRSKFQKFSKRLLYVGRLESEKNPCLALRAFATAPHDSCLIIVGGGSERPHLEKLAHELNVAERVFFESETDSAPYYALSDLVLVPSRYEGYGLVIIEALAAGKPVLSTDVGIAREAGAIVAEEKDYSEALKRWFAEGPFSGTLASYPYNSFEDYVSAYCADAASAAVR